MLLCIAASAQTFEWSNTQKLRGNSIYTTIIGEDESGIYILRHRNKFLSKFIVLERYRHNLGLENSKSYLLKNTRILYSDINETGIILIKQVYENKKHNYKIVATVLNSSFEPVQPDVVIAYTSCPQTVENQSFLIKPSPNHKHYFLFNYGLTNAKPTFNQYVIFDQKIKIIEDGKVEFEQNLKIESVMDVVFDNNLKYSLFVELKQDETKFKQYAVCEQTGLKKIRDTAYSLECATLFYNPTTDTKGITGFYTSQIESGFEGNFSVTWKNFDQDSFKIIKQPFSSTVIKALSADVKSQSGFLPSTYSPLKVVSTTDGGFIKISENTYTQKEQEMVVVNGAASAVGKNIYTFENLLIQNFNSKGQFVWENWVIKNQNTFNDGGLLGSVIISVFETSINILYNDPIANGGDIVLAKILPNGQRDQTIAVKGDVMNAFIIPGEAKQISSDKIIVPVLKDRKFALLKITFKQ